MLIPCKFTIENLEIFEGFFNPNHKYWNGWLNPYVTAETHKKICKFVLEGLTEENRENYSDCLEYANMKPNAEGLYYWGGCFIWEEIEEE